MQRRTILAALSLAGLYCAAAPARVFAAPKAEKEANVNETGLLIIDLQNDYFPGGAFELDRAEEACVSARAALERFRSQGLPVIHIRHETLRPGATFFLPGTPGAQIHPQVAPLPGETVVLKHFPNSFRETDLEARLRALGVKRLVVAGMMTNMCVDATVRAAVDLGYTATVLHDACAAHALAFEGLNIPAPQVHGAFLAALGMIYAEVVSTENFLGKAGR
jgi:nicotinamidase-related amidase